MRGKFGARAVQIMSVSSRILEVVHRACPVSTPPPTTRNPLAPKTISKTLWICRPHRQMLWTYPNPRVNALHPNRVPGQSLTQPSDCSITLIPHHINTPLH